MIKVNVLIRNGHKILKYLLSGLPFLAFQAKSILCRCAAWTTATLGAGLQNCRLLWLRASCEPTQLRKLKESPCETPMWLGSQSAQPMHFLFGIFSYWSFGKKEGQGQRRLGQVGVLLLACKFHKGISPRWFPVRSDVSHYGMRRLTARAVAGETHVHLGGRSQRTDPVSWTRRTWNSHGFQGPRSHKQVQVLQHPDLGQGNVTKPYSWAHLRRKGSDGCRGVLKSMLVFGVKS